MMVLPTELWERRGVGEELGFSRILIFMLSYRTWPVLKGMGLNTVRVIIEILPQKLF